MGLLALFAGMGVGFLQNIGRSSRAYQAASILAESGFECRNRSIGGRHATLTLANEADADGNERLVLSQSVQRPVLTAHFETPDWFVNAAGPAAATPEGAVTLDPDGKSGSCVVVGQGGLLDFGSHPAFAPTDGVEIGVWVRPAAGRGAMAVLAGEECYELSLVRQGATAGGDAYDVQLRLRLLDAGDDSGRTGALGAWTVFDTEGAPVLAGRWSHVQASFDGKEARLRVDGIERTRESAASRARRGARPPAGPAAPAAAAPDAAEESWRRLALPASGGVRLTLSQRTRPYVGAVDTLFVQGVFRSDEDRRTLASGLRVETPRLPMTVRFHNGRLDPLVHRADVAIVLQDEASPETERFVVRYGLYGLVSPARALLPGESGVPVPTTPATPATAAR
jgi:hypothetical protein